MYVFELLAQLQRMPRDVVVEFVIDGEILDDNGARVDLILNPNGFTVARLSIKVKE